MPSDALAGDRVDATDAAPVIIRPAQLPSVPPSREMYRVLLVHNRYQRPGGEDVVFETESALLEAAGHPVARLELHNDAADGVSKAELARRTVWSREGHAAVEAAARAHRADVVHFHNTLPLVSPAGYYGARAAGAAVVQTIHNFRLVCPSAMLFRDGHVCESCLGKALALPGVRHGCYRGSRAATLAVATMTAVHRAMGTWDTAVDRYVAITPFMRETLVRGGYDGDRIAVKANTLRALPALASRGGGHVLFASRLDAGKGVETLMRAWEADPGLPPLVVAGDGLLAHVVRDAADRLGTRPDGTPRVRFVGWQTAEGLDAIRETAEAFVFPSEWYEGGTPIAFVESLARGLPVVASDIPTVRGMVRDGEEGRLYPAGDALGLAAAVRDVMADAGRRAFMADAARRTAERNHSPLATLVALRRIYAEAVAVRHPDRRPEIPAGPLAPPAGAPAPPEPTPAHA